MSNISTIDIWSAAVSMFSLYFVYFTRILLVAYICTPPLDRRWGHKILKQAKLGQFSIFSLQNWTKVCLNHPYNGLVSLDCTDVSSDSLKKERLCLQIVLGQAWFELYCTSIFFCWTQPFGIRIGSASRPCVALQLHVIWRAYIENSCRRNKATIVNVAFWVFLLSASKYNDF